MSRFDVETTPRRPGYASLRFYRIALFLSLVTSVLLATGIWYYSSIEVITQGGSPSG